MTEVKPKTTQELLAALKPKQLEALIKIADNELYWAETKRRLAARGKLWVAFAVGVAAVYGAWTAGRSFIIDIVKLIGGGGQ